MRKAPFKSVIPCFVITTALLLPYAAHARDLQDEDAAGLSRFCESIWKIGKKAAQNRDNGLGEDEALETLDEAMRQMGLGPNAQHVMRTTVKGAYLHASDTPSQYAAASQNACMQAIR